MPMGLKDLVAEARTQIPAVSPQQSKDQADLILDVREPVELEDTGRISGALNIPRGVLETRADPDSPTAERRLTALRGAGRVHVLCASGGRAAMAAHTLSRMGYDAAVIEGGMSGWKKAGLPVEG